MTHGNLWNDARASTRPALRLVAECSTLAQLAEAVRVTTGSPSRAPADHERRVGV